METQGRYAEEYRRFTVQLTVEPWVSPETVERVYRAVQRELWGGACRRLGKRSLDLFRFRVESANGALPGWRERMEQWNAAHRAAAYTDPRNFARDVKRAYRAILSPAARLMAFAQRSWERQNEDDVCKPPA